MFLFNCRDISDAWNHIGDMQQKIFWCFRPVEFNLVRDIERCNHPMQAVMWIDHRLISLVRESAQYEMLWSRLPWKDEWCFRICRQSRRPSINEINSHDRMAGLCVFCSHLQFIHVTEHADWQCVSCVHQPEICDGEWSYGLIIEAY